MGWWAVPTLRDFERFEVMREWVVRWGGDRMGWWAVPTLRDLLEGWVVVACRCRY